MNEEGNCLEENTARLVRAAYGPSARPSPEASQRVFRLLLGHVRVRPATPGFPDAALVALGAIVVFLAVGLAIQVAFPMTSLNASPSLLAAAMVLILNLAWVPVASIVIVLRRRYGQ